MIKLDFTFDKETAALRKLEYQVQRLEEANAQLWKELNETRMMADNTRHLVSELWTEHADRKYPTQLQDQLEESRRHCEDNNCVMPVGHGGSHIAFSGERWTVGA